MSYICHVPLAALAAPPQLLQRCRRCAAVSQGNGGKAITFSFKIFVLRKHLISNFNLLECIGTYRRNAIRHNVRYHFAYRGGRGWGPTTWAWLWPGLREWLVSRFSFTLNKYCTIVLSVPEPKVKPSKWAPNYPANASATAAPKCALYFGSIRLHLPPTQGKYAQKTEEKKEKKRKRKK